MDANLDSVAAALKSALGAKQVFGPEEGLSAKELRNYHYMFGMEYFDEPSVLAEYGSYDEAVTAVENALAAKKGGVSKVYRIDVPGKSESEFGVHMTNDCSSDKFIMGNIDGEKLDWNQKFIRVERSYKRGRFEKTKNGKVRRVDMSDQLISALRQLLTTRKKEGS